MNWLRPRVLQGAFATVVALSSASVNGQSPGCYLPDAMHCNGLPNLCDMPVNKVMFGMVHNAMSSTEAGFVFYANHRFDPFNTALDAGYRAVKLDLCNCEDQLTFCHGGRNVGCGIGSRDPVSTFSKLNNWLDEHPNEVVVIYLSLNEAAEGSISLDDVSDIIQAVPNQFAGKLYNHERGAEWPVLGDLINSNQRILLFYVNGPEGRGENPPGIHYFYDYGMETDSMYENVNNLENGILQGCKVVKGVESSKEFFLFNNFVTGNSPFGQFVPSQSAARKINSLDFAKPMCQVCEQMHNVPMNLIAVDFWNNGNIPELVQQHNEMLLAPGATLCPTGVPSSAPSLTPTTMPSSAPSLEPTTSPSEIPTERPSRMPSVVPSLTPSSIPSQRPTSRPTSTPIIKSATASSNQASQPTPTVPTLAADYSIQQNALRDESALSAKDYGSPASKIFSILLKVMFIISGLVGLVSEEITFVDGLRILVKSV